MGTKAVIGAGTVDGKVMVIGLAYGAEPKEKLQQLKKYNTSEKVAALLSFGRIYEIEYKDIENLPEGWFKCIPNAGELVSFHKHQPYNHTWTWEEVKPKIVTKKAWDDLEIGDADYESSYFYFFDNKTLTWSVRAWDDKNNTSTLYLNNYKCPYDGTVWDDTSDSMCNDRCPECNKEIEPLYSEEI